jgi:hypothetical protein
MQYSLYVPSLATPSNEEIDMRKKLCAEHIRALGNVIELKSDYFNASTYFYSREKDSIYDINSWDKPAHILVRGSQVDLHLRELNEKLISENCSIHSSY